MSKGKLKFGVLAVSAMGMGAMVTNPVLADIMKAFPDIDPTTVMLISGLPSLFIVFFAPIYGKLTQYFPKKALFAFASLCFVLGGFLPAFMTHFSLILAMRCLLGIGLGFLMPMAADLISDFFDGHERETMMGFQSAFTSIGGIMYQMAGGFLGSFGWNYAFYAYLLGVLIFLAVHLALPEPQRKVAPKGERLKMPSRVYPCFVALFAFQMILFILTNNAAVMLDGEKIADASSIGVALTLMTVGGLIGGFLAGKVMRVLKDYTFTLLFLLFGIGFGIGYTSYTLAQFFVATTIIGLSMGVLVPSYWVKLSITVPPPLVALAISIGVSAMNIGGFIQPYVYDGVSKLFGLQIGRDSFLVGMVASLLMAAFVLVEAMVTRKASPSNVSAR
ncbi:MFS transporter [Desulfitobacterium sp. PCE1]|uniref:MFS transporter n=1 Tax=Desulfitobacterium sp. PCE1 TaxID=146907 RepID=UPI0003800410|nr:MFS transporter [Desulfitobacterium sp. PCE1]